MSVKASALKTKEIKAGIYYIDGGDAYWVKYAEKAFRALLPEDSLSLFVFDKLNSMDEPLTALDTMSFFDGANVVIVKDSDYKASDRDHKMLEKANTGENYLLFINVKFLNDREKKLFTCIECKKSEKYECVKYAETLFKFGIERDALNRLVEYTDCDMAKIYNESIKLFDYCGERRVKSEDVEELVSEDTELQIFTFVSSVTEGKKAQAKKQLQRLLKYGNSPSVLLAALIGQYRRMLHASLSDKSDAELSKLMKVKEYAVTKARSGRRIGKKTLKNTLDMLIEYEFKFKSGEMSDKAAFNAAIGRLLGEEVA